MEEVPKCFDVLNRLWLTGKKEDFHKTLYEELSKSENPYELTLSCVKCCPDLYKSKGCNMAANILVVHQGFISKTGNKDKYGSCLTPSLVQNAFQVATRQQNAGLLKLMVQGFDFVSCPKNVMPMVSTLLSRGQYKDVCAIAVLLNIQDKISTEELLIPMFFLDGLGAADEFLSSSPTHVKQLLQFIDAIVGKKVQVNDYLNKYKVINTWKFRKARNVCQIGGRLMKKFKIDSSLYPNLHNRITTSGLRYLFYKHYIEKGIQTPAFHSLVEDVIKDNPDIINNMLNLFLEYCDPQGSLPYVAKFQIPRSLVPFQIQHILDTGDKGTAIQGIHFSGSNSIDEETSWDNDEEEYYKLSIPENCVSLVTTPSDFDAVIGIINNSVTVAVDCEWKPTFGIGSIERVALLQVATHVFVYLIDIITLQPLLSDAQWDDLAKIFSNSELTKIGYDIMGDLKNLAKVHPRLAELTLNVNNVLDMDQIKIGLLQEVPDIFEHHSTKFKGLSDLVFRCFGVPLDKRDQFSNWVARPLTRQQMYYAALDAYCLIDVFSHLSNRSKYLGINDWKIIKSSKKSSNSPKEKEACKQKRYPSVPMTRAPGQAIPASEFKVVCDTMVQKAELC